jgi:hypothetical protein
MNGSKSKAIDREHAPKTQQNERLNENPYLKKFSTNGFLPDYNAEFDEEFDRLAEHMGWLKLGKAYKRHHSQALEQQRKVSPPVQKGAIGRGLQEDRPSPFFEKFVRGGFTRTTNSSFDVEFNQLAKHMGWSKKSKEFRKHKIIATKQEITSSYGGSSRLEGWQQLCDDVGVEPIPSSIKKCKKVCTFAERSDNITLLIALGACQSLYQPLRPYRLAAPAFASSSI